jgi:two-component system, NarL family, nitrate/nitrite response regulator NarL
MSKSEQSASWINDKLCPEDGNLMSAVGSMLPDIKDVLMANNDEPIRTSFPGAQSIAFSTNGFKDVRPGSVSAEEAASKTVRLLIVGGYALQRDALRASFMNTAGFQVVGEAEEGDAAFRLSCREMPDVILLELPLACESEMSFLSRIRSEDLPMQMVMLASSLHAPGVMAAMKLGVKGVVLKDSATLQALCEAIRWVAAGGYWVGQERVPTLTHALHILGACSDDAFPQRHFGLTARESEILPMLARGYSNRAIATAFSISVETIKHHCSHIYDKIGTSNRVELALFAIQHHLLDSCLPARMKIRRPALRGSSTSAAFANGQF